MEWTGSLVFSLLPERFEIIWVKYVLALDVELRVLPLPKHRRRSLYRIRLISKWCTRVVLSSIDDRVLLGQLSLKLFDLSFLFLNELLVIVVSFCLAKGILNAPIEFVAITFLVRFHWRHLRCSELFCSCLNEWVLDPFSFLLCEKLILLVTLLFVEKKDLDGRSSWEVVVLWWVSLCW